MKYTNEVVDQILILRFEGDLIGENHGSELVSLVHDHLNKNINLCAIDISGVRYINSSGIGVLITMLTKFRNKGGEVALINPSKTVEKLLHLTKLNSIFAIFDTEENAMQELKKSES